MDLAPPTYWSGPPSSTRAWTIAPVSPSELDALKIGMVPGGSLGGRDQRTKLDYKGMEAVSAWRLQHLGLWGKYAMERENLKKYELKSLENVGIPIPAADVRDTMTNMAARLPGTLDPAINEVYLSHGTKPESIMAILSGGLNERFSGGLFGNGTYLAEDIGKNDQYCTYDHKYKDHKELHELLYDDHNMFHSGDVLYVVFCRVILGCYARTKDGNTNSETGKSLWSSQNRELAVVAGSNPPVHHHSLVVDVGGKVLRYREFLVFHGDRVYPEYLVAYQRK